MSVIVLMQGWPGSGKSTYARKLADDTGAMVINRDLIREMLFGPNYWTEKRNADYHAGKCPDEEMVTIAERATALAFLRRSINIIVDATHIKKSDIKSWERIADKHGHELVYLRIETPLQDCIARDQAREQAGGRRVGEDIIRLFAKNHPMESWPK